MPELTSAIWWAIVLGVFVILGIAGVFIFSVITYQRRLLFAEKQKTEDARRSAQKYSDLFNNVTDLIFVHGLDGRIIQINQAVERCLGYAPEDLRNQPFTALVAPQFRQQTAEYLKRIVEDKESTGVLHLVNTAGKVHIFEFRNSLVEEGGKPVSVRGIARDVTEQKRAEKDLRDSEQRFRRLTDYAPLPIAVHTKGRWVYANTAALNLIAADSLAEVLGKSILHFIPVRRRKGFGQSVRKNPVDKDVFVLEEVIQSLDGQEKETEIVAIPIIYDGMSAVQVVIRDVTAQRKLQRESARAQRLETAGRIAGQIAHDFNNLLAPLTTYPTMIREDLPADHDAFVLVNEMEYAAQTIAEINQQLLALGRRGHYSMHLINPNDLLNDVLNSVRSGKSIVVEKRFAPGIYHIKGGNAQLTRAFANLITNAQEAMQGIGRLTVTTSNVNGRSRNDGNLVLPPGNYVRVDISDTGSGIDPSILERIYDPFFTTKEMDRMRGSGLGLSIVHGIIEDHEGYISVDSILGKGTTFSILFPATEPVDVSSAGVTDEMPGGQGETILLVDDDNLHRRVTSEFLKRLGYRVTAVDSGEKAAEVGRTNPHELVILDMVMGGMDGTDTFRELILSNPAQKAILMSGYAISERVREALELGVSEFVQKPLVPKTLARVVRRILNSNSRAPKKAG